MLASRSGHNSSSAPASGKLELIAVGTVGVVYALDEKHVIKRPFRSRDNESKAYDIEIRAYRRLGGHCRIARCIEASDAGLVLERGECLRRRLQRLQQGEIALSLRLRWAREAAEGLAYVHANRIVHADVGCHNLILDPADQVKLIDFAGSSIDGEDALVCYEWCSYYPKSAIGVQTDIFAFGSTLFEIESGKQPYHELERTLDLGELTSQVENLFLMKRFPTVDMLVLGDIIARCWDGEYRSMDDIYRDIAARCDEYMDRSPGSSCT